MPKVTANGKKFNFPDGTTPEQMGEAIDSYFGSQAPAPEAQAPAPQQAPEPDINSLPLPPPSDDPRKQDRGVGAYEQRVQEMNPFMRALTGAGGAVNGLLIGAKQMIPDSLKSPEQLAQIQQEAEQHKAAMKPLEATTAGQVGSIAGNIGAAIPAGMAAAALAPAGLGVAGAVGAGALEGGLMGALAPTTKPGERAENVMWGAGGGGVVPLAGKGVRALVGQGDEAMSKAAQVLKRYGVNVPLSRQGGGGINKTADYVLENTPVISNFAKNAADTKTDKVRSALFNMVGSDVPKSNDEMAKVVSGLGQDIGNFSKGKVIPVGDIKDGVKGVMKDYKNLLPAQRNPQVMRYAAQLTNLSETKGAKLKGEAYQSIRADMANEAAKAAPEHAKALRGMVKVLDDEFSKTIKPEEAAAFAAKKRQYRLAKILDTQDMKEGAMDVNKARTAIERNARKGEVMPAARELLDAADIGIPKVRPGGVASAPGMAAVGTVLTNPAMMAKALGLSGTAKALLNTGVPQKLANSPLSRKATARALKGILQTELSDGD
jgi:hypothetical protein